MRSSLVAALTLICALSASAGTITSINPSTVKVNSGEHFITVYGTSLGSTLVFDGPAGHFEVQVGATFTGSVVGWVPEAVVAKSGIHTLYVRNNGVASNTVNFTVQGFKYFPLAILVPEALLFQASSREGAIGSYQVIAIGSEDPRPIVSCSPKSGSFFKFGTNKVSCTATSTDGQRATADFTVSVADMMPPILKLPEKIEVKPQDRFGAYVDFKPTAFDEIYGEVIPECLPRSGSQFPIGTTTVTCSATDVDLNTEWGTFDVTVLGDPVEPLVVITPERVVEKARDPRGAEVFFEVYVKNSKANPVVDCSPKSGSLFAIGQTSVYCTAYDENGARGEAGFLVDVIDANPPDILRLGVSPEKISPADRRLVPVKVDVTAVDDIDIAPVCMVFDVTANEALDLPGDGAKDTFDYRFDPKDPLALELRAEANEVDRIYDIHVDCSDFYGNQTRSTVQVLVPRSATGGTTVAQPTKRRAAGR